MPYVQYPKPRPMLQRAEANRLLERLVVRAREINRDPIKFPYAVRRLVVFGSYLTDREILGDLDIGVEMKLVRPFSELTQERPTWRPIHWGNRTVVALQVRKPKLVNVHDIADVQSLNTPVHQVFEDQTLRPPPATWMYRSS